MSKDRSRPGVGGLPHPLETLKIIRERKSEDPWSQVDTLAHVQAGKTCSRCRHFVDKVKGQEELQRDEFWDRVFHAHDDGTDFKPHHIGDPKCYSICRKLNCACHELSSCKDWET